MESSPRYLRLTGLGQRAFSRGRLHRAHALFQAAEAEARATGDQELLDRAFCNRCVVLVELEQLDGSLGELKHVLMRTRDPFTAWMAAYYTAQVYEFQDNLPRALSYARRASELAQGCGAPEARAASANQHGVLALRDSHFEEAGRCFREALQLDHQHGNDPVGAAATRDNLGYCLMCTGDVPQGIALCSDAAATLEAAGARHMLAEVYQDLCYGFIEQGDLAAAQVFGEQALELAREFAVDKVEANTLVLLAEAAMASGDEAEVDLRLEQLSRYYPDSLEFRHFLEAFNVLQVINLKA